MSTHSQQQLLSGETLPVHLTTNPSSRIAPDLEIDAARGLFYCEDCNRRITRNRQSHREYGHDLDCEHHETADVTT